MKIALISDIHGNLIALEAVLTELQQQGFDQLVCLGDVAAVGPQPGEVIERLSPLNGLMVMGNTDAWLCNPEELATVETLLPPPVKAINQWSLARLTADHLAYLRTFQPRINLELGNGRNLLCFHGSPQSHNDILLATTPDETLAELLAGYEATILAGGHTHIPLLRRFRKMLLMNPGSVGSNIVQFQEMKKEANWAEYAILNGKNGRFYIEFHHVSLDIKTIQQIAFDSGMPHANWWAQTWL